MDKVIAKERRGDNELILIRFAPGDSVTNLDGDSCKYRIEYRWYNVGGGVQGNEFSYWHSRDIKPVIAALENGGSLFDHFNLF